MSGDFMAIKPGRCRKNQKVYSDQSLIRNPARHSETQRNAAKENFVEEPKKLGEFHNRPVSFDLNKMMVIRSALVGVPQSMMNAPPMDKGIPLGLALRRWTHPRLISKLDDLDARAAEQPHDVQLKKDAKTFRAQLQSDFIASLLVRSNQFWLTSYLDAVTPTSHRGEVSWDVIRDIDYWDFDTSEAWFEAADEYSHDMHLIRIEVLGPIPKWEVERLSGAASTPLETNEAVPLHLSDDNATLTVLGKRFIFRGQKQQRILRQLFDAYESGDRLRTTKVLEKAQAKADSLRKAFNNSPHWSVLQRIIRREQGYCWFDVR
jgi:hypothetical protein